MGPIALILFHGRVLNLKHGLFAQDHALPVFAGPLLTLTGAHRTLLFLEAN